MVVSTNRASCSAIESVRQPIGGVGQALFDHLLSTGEVSGDQFPSRRFRVAHFQRQIADRAAMLVFF